MNNSRGVPFLDLVSPHLELEEDLVAIYCTQLLGGDFAIRAHFATMLYQSIVGN